MGDDFRVQDRWKIATDREGDKFTAIATETPALKEYIDRVTIELSKKTQEHEIDLLVSKLSTKDIVSIIDQLKEELIRRG